ncbi:MAG: cyclic nucleotide-binding protein, partial [Bacteroidota bacterium]
VTQWISSTGYFITDLNSFVFDQRARWNMQALSDCIIYTIKKDSFRELKKHVPTWTEMEKHFISGCFITMEDRVFSHLSLTAEQRYDELFKQNQELFNQVPLQYLASMLGMTPETFSRIRNKKLS